MTVPQRHADPASTPLQLAVIRILATGDQREPDPVVFAQGGPGGSGLDFAAAAPALVEAFAGRDLILFDQRGAGHSVPFLHCDEHDPGRPRRLTGQTPAAGALDADIAAYAACAARFAAAGYDLSAFDTLESAADVRDVVTALGYADYDFYGVSYGTRIGQALLRDVPDGLRSVALDSVVPVTVNTQAQRATTVYGALQALFAACAAEDACSAAHPDLERTLFDTASTLSAAPVHVPVVHGDSTLDVVVDGQGFLRSVAERFYAGADGIDAIPSFIQEAADGDLGAVATALAADATDTTLADGLYYSVHCSEDQPGATDYAFEGVPEQLHFLANQQGDRNTLLETCAAMNVADAGGSVRDAATSDVPVLTMSGEFDPVTPASYADTVRTTLAASFGLEFPGIGHGVLLAADCPTAAGGRVHRRPDP